jgi:hypothetical protein
LALGIFAGLTLAAAQVWWAPDLRIARGRTISPEEFTKKAFGTVGIDHLPGLRNLTVYPPTQVGDAGPAVQFVTGEACEKITRQPYRYEPFTFYADVPFTAGGSAAEPKSFANVQAFLRAGGPRARATPFRYAWWASAPIIFAAWLAAGVLVLGVAAPVLVAGVRTLRRPPGPSPADSAVATGAVATAAAVEAFTDELERQVDTPPAQAESSPTAQAEPAPVSTLDATPLAPSPEQEAQEPAEYRGEYYPVAKPHAEAHVPPADHTHS